jgi:hypothetical protein
MAQTFPCGRENRGKHIPVAKPEKGIQHRPDEWSGLKTILLKKYIIIMSFDALFEYLFLF